MLPFLGGRKEGLSEPVVEVPPVFPNQSAAVSSTELPIAEIPALETGQPVQPVEIAPVIAVQSHPSQTISSQVSAPVLQEASAESEQKQSMKQPLSSRQAQASFVQEAIADSEKVSLKKIKNAAAHHVVQAVVSDKRMHGRSLSSKKNQVSVDHGLLQLKTSAWVIQLGSFKNKANALRLVNDLRQKGYKAFLQTVSSPFGDSTRVYVGPEYKHVSAEKLASELERELHLRGIVISFKPLALL